MSNQEECRRGGEAGVNLIDLRGFDVQETESGVEKIVEDDSRDIFLHKLKFDFFISKTYNFQFGFINQELIVFDPPLKGFPEDLSLALFLV